MSIDNAERLTSTPAELDRLYAGGQEQPIDGDDIARARQVIRKFNAALESVTKAFHAISAACSTLAANVAVALEQFATLDPKVQARVRNGHPPYPRQQLLHNGRKPKR